MNRVISLFQREQGVIVNDRCYDFALRRLCVSKGDSWLGITPSNYGSDYNPEPPILSAKFANCDGYRHILAIANEDGKIALQDVTKKNEDLEEKALSAPQCHYNAVFDLEWAPGQMKFVSASGDHTARLWEIDGSDIRHIRTFDGHTRSVKTAAFRRNDASVFATGGRDGAIIIWDTRANLNVDLTSRADNCIYSGHAGGPSTPASQKKRLRTPRLQPPVTSSSITGLVFQDNTTLVSCGAGDGIIKVWDMRRNYSVYKKEPLPKFSFHYAGTSTFKGFTNLLIDEAGCRLYANCMDNTIYSYNLISYSSVPLATYTGLRNNTFYIKSCLSPDGKYLLSGSSDEKAYIWNLNNSEPLISLCGHAVEVTCVAWGSSHDQPIVTCSDDARHKIWRIGPEQLDDDERIFYRGHAEFLRTYKKALQGKNPQFDLKDLECTPRSLKRIVDQNEKTPNSAIKITNKRTFADVAGDEHLPLGDENDQKRLKTSEARGRRLFSPLATTSLAQRCLNLSLATIEENNNQENDMLTEVDSPMETMIFGKILSPLSERIEKNQNPLTSPSEAGASAGHTSVIYSPTTNLPNYVLDGDAPHLGIMSPKRKQKEKIDWLTKIRKQKLMTTATTVSCREKFTENDLISKNDEQSDFLSSPRLQSLRSSIDCSSSSTAASTSPNRRLNRAGSHGTEPKFLCSSPKTPTSSSNRRKSETSILRFFTKQQQQQQEEQKNLATSTLMSPSQQQQQQNCCT